MIEDNRKYWVWLSLLSKLNTNIKKDLLLKYKEPKNIYKLEKKELIENNKIGEKTAEMILDKNIRLKLDNYLKEMEKNKIDIITIKDKEYPSILKKIEDFPLILYIKGNKNILDNKNIAIIGCRECTEYGRKAAVYFSYNLAKENIAIVSGLAKGIDTYSHIGALKARGRTIAVLGNGLDIIYPKQNEKIYEGIVKSGGAIITEYPLGTKPEKNNFPERNRIISGMSKGVLIIEAKEKSGTIITADFALNQGRDVFALPGNINSANSVGTNRLIKEGAIPVTNFRDILDFF